MNTGKSGEILVKMFLMKHGYNILATNLRVYQGKQIGEIDILALKINVLYIVEVKSSNYKSSCRWGRDEILTHRKYRRLARIRSLILAIKSMRSAERSLFGREYFIYDSTDSKLTVSVLTDEVLDQVFTVKIILAEVTIQRNNTYDVEFSPIN